MILNDFNAILSILLPTGSGFVLLSWICWKYTLPMPLRLALAYGLGLGTLSLWMFGLYALNIPFNLFILRLPLILIMILGIIVYFITPQENLRTTRKALFPAHKEAIRNNQTPLLRAILASILLTYIAVNISYVFWRALTVPIISWDAVATVAFKAKIFFFESSSPSIQNLPHRSYPLLTPFMETWTAFNLGRWDDVQVKIIFPIALLSFLTIFFEFLKHYTNRYWSLLGCAILISSNFFLHHATISYRDFLLMYYNCATIILLILWNERKSAPLLILASLFAGFAAFTKLEGTLYLSVHILLFLLMIQAKKEFPIYEKLKASLIWIVTAGLFPGLFHIYKISTNISPMENRLNFSLTCDHLRRIPEILYSFIGSLNLDNNWNIIWTVLFFSLVYNFRKLRCASTQLFLFLTLTAFFFLHFIFYSITDAHIDYPTTLTRVILHFFPLAPLLIILLNYPTKENP